MRDEVQATSQPDQRPPRVTMEAIIGATTHTLRTVGWQGASTQAIAELAGVSEAAIYQYYPNRQALLAAVMENHIDEMIVVMGSRIAESLTMPLDEAVEALVDAAMMAHALDPQLHRVLVQELPRVGMIEKLQHFEDRMVEAVTGMLVVRAQELHLDEPRVAAFMIVHAANGLIHRALLETSSLLDESVLRRELTAMIGAYLGLRLPTH